MEQDQKDAIRRAKQLNEDFATLSLSERLVVIGSTARHAVFTTSLGMEDQVLTRAVALSTQNIRLVTLQTGRLFPETNALLGTTRDHYNIDIKEYYPDSIDLQNYVKSYGIDGLYNSIEARKACCGVRKLAPLAAALRDADVWITGLRRGQSQQRQDVAFVEWDPARQLLKVNPLADWTLEQLKQEIADCDIPINPLHASGFPSIGCQPCTHAIKPGEDERAGRWWWEKDNSRECGLHVEERADPVASRELSPQLLSTPDRPNGPSTELNPHA